MAEHSRVPAGVPTGGQFAAHTRADAESSLSGAAPAADPRVVARTSSNGAELDRLALSATPDVVHAIAENRHAHPRTLRRIAAEASHATVTRMSVATNPSADEVTVELLANDNHPAVRFCARQHPRHRPTGVAQQMQVALERFVYGPRAASAAR